MLIFNKLNLNNIYYSTSKNKNMKAYKILILCITSVMLMSAGCNDETDCPECPVCPDPSTPDLGNRSNTQSLLALYEDLPEENLYHSTKLVTFTLEDMQAMVNQCRREGAREIIIMPAAFTEEEANTYANRTGVGADEVLHHNFVIIGRKVPGGIIRAFAANYGVCPPPGSCGNTDTTQTNY